MFTKEMRPLTPPERDEAARIAKSGRKGWGNYALNFFFAVLCGMIFGALAGTILKRIPALRGWKQVDDYCILIGAVAGVILGMKMTAELLRIRGKGNQPLLEDLKAGQAEVLRCEIAECVQVEEFEDEGSGYFLSDGRNQVLFLQGQYLYDLEEAGKFPSRTFEVVRLPKSRTFLGLTTSGEQVKPVRALNKENFKLYPRLPFLVDDGDLFPGSLSTLEQNLKSLKGGGR